MEHTLRKLHAELARSDARTIRKPRQAKAHRAVSRRLSQEAQDSLIAEYRQGASSYELAARYGLSKTGVLGLLHARGVEMRRQPMPSDLAAEAARLYKSGLSLVRVGQALGISPSTVHGILLASGVVMRDRHERKRADLDMT